MGDERNMIEGIEEIQRLSRAERQARVARWCADAFGADSQYDRRKRALRLLEEAFELFQAEGGSADQATHSHCVFFRGHWVRQQSRREASL